MADHAIVLYDPTIDHRETDEERKERLAAEQKQKEMQEIAETAGSENLFNPHKSLRSLLGETGSKASAPTRIPVVIDPLLSKRLRPHQVEGVKVSVGINLRSKHLINNCI